MASIFETFPQVSSAGVLMGAMWRADCFWDRLQGHTDTGVSPHFMLLIQILLNCLFYLHLSSEMMCCKSASEDPERLKMNNARFCPRSSWTWSRAGALSWLKWSWLLCASAGFTCVACRSRDWPTSDPVEATPSQKEAVTRSTLLPTLFSKGLHKTCVTCGTVSVSLLLFLSRCGFKMQKHLYLCCSTWKYARTQSSVWPQLPAHTSSRLCSLFPHVKLLNRS